MNAMPADSRMVANALAADYNARISDPRRRAKQWLSALLPNAILYLVVMPLISGWKRGYDLSTPGIAIFLSGMVVATAASIALSDRAHRRMVLVAQGRKSMTSDVERFTGKGWVLRTTLLGVYMGLAVGVPVGLLVALFLSDDFGIGSERWMHAGIFVALTIGYMIPLAFGIRWLALRLARRRTH